MTRRSFTSYPSQFEFISRRLASVHLEISRGIQGGWDVPFAIWRAPEGMDAAFPASEHATITCLHHRSNLRRVDKAGKGNRGGAARNEVIMYGGGYDRHYVCQDDASCDQIYMTRDLIAECGLEVFGVAGLELRDDRLFLPDAVLRRSVQHYVQRGLNAHLPPTRLEMNAQAIMMALHMVTGYSNGTGAKELKARRLSAKNLNAVLERIEASLDGDLRVADLSSEVGLGVRQFFGAFRASVGTTPHAYLLERRLVKSQALLRGKASLAEIALECGFASQQHFSAAFRKAIGTSPGAWRGGL